MWGPGKYDPRHHAFDKPASLADARSLPVVIPPAYGLKTLASKPIQAMDRSRTGTAMSAYRRWGHGNFSDPRIGLFIGNRPTW
jgi:hypothetical protein